VRERSGSRTRTDTDQIEHLEEEHAGGGGRASPRGSDDHRRRRVHGSRQVYDASVQFLRSPLPCFLMAVGVSAGDVIRQASYLPTTYCLRLRCGSTGARRWRTNCTGRAFVRFSGRPAQAPAAGCSGTRKETDRFIRLHATTTKVIALRFLCMPACSYTELRHRSQMVLKNGLV